MNPSYFNKHIQVLFCTATGIFICGSAKASVIAPVISFGISDSTNQDFDNGTYDNNANTYVSDAVTGHADNSFEGNNALNFQYNDHAHFTLTVTGSDDVVSGSSGGRIGVGNEWLDNGESLSLQLSVSVDSGYQITALYMDYLKISNWASGASMTLGDGTTTSSAYTHTSGDDSEQVFSYSGKPSSDSNNNPYWRSPDADSNTITGLNALTTSNIGGIGTNTWELIITNNGSDDLALDELSIHFQVDEVPEPATTSLLALSGLTFLLRRKRQ